MADEMNQMKKSGESEVKQEKREEKEKVSLQTFPFIVTISLSKKRSPLLIISEIKEGKAERRLMISLDTLKLYQFAKQIVEYLEKEIKNV